MVSKAAPVTFFSQTPCGEKEKKGRRLLHCRYTRCGACLQSGAGDTRLIFMFFKRISKLLGWWTKTNINRIASNAK